MALTPADFYAYSRATGAPIPEDPEERVEMAPEVLEFRRNQLKAPQEESNPLAAIGAAALGLGALAGIGFGARRFLAREPQIPKGPSKSATAGVRQVNLSEMQAPVRRAAAAPVRSSTPEPAPSKVVTRSVMPTEAESFEVFNRQLQRAIPEPTAQEIDFSNAPQRYTQGSPRFGYAKAYRPDPKDINEAILGPVSQEVAEARRAAATERLLAASQQRRLSSESLTDVQQSQRLANTDQFINAVESGEDQTTGRLIKQLNIADPWGQSSIPPSAINNQQPTLLLPAAAVSPREKAQEYLQTRFEELGAVMPGRYRRERAMGQDPQIAEAMELYASTGDPSVLSRLSAAPSSPLTVTPRVQTEIKDKEQIPTGMLYQATGRGEFIDDLFEKDIKLTNRISSLGVDKQNVLNRLEEIDQLEPQLRFAAANEPGQGGYYTRMLNKMLFEKQSLKPESVNADLGDALAERDFVRAQMESAEALGSKYKLVPRQEGVRPFFEVDPVSGQPIAETLEIRSGRPSVQLEEQKTGGGRGYAMYDPESQTGSSIGAYGIEPRNFPIADPELRPTVLQREETKMALRQEPIRSSKQQKLQAIKASQIARQAIIEGRDVQDALKLAGF